MRLNKTLFLIFLVLYFIAGLSLLITGSVAHRYASKYAEITGGSIMSGAGFIIALGVIIIILSALGFIGAFKNRLGLLKVFIGSLVLILLLQFIAIIVGFTLRNKADKKLSNKLYSSLAIYRTGNPDVVTEWDNLQQRGSCCGVNSSLDWIEPAKPVDIPKSCCPKRSCTQSKDNQTNYFQPGCYQSAQNMFYHYSKALGGVSLFFFFVEIAGTMLATLLLRDLKNNYGSV